MNIHHMNAVVPYWLQRYNKLHKILCFIVSFIVVVIGVLYYGSTIMPLWIKFQHHFGGGLGPMPPSQLAAPLAPTLKWQAIA